MPSKIVMNLSELPRNCKYEPSGRCFVISYKQGDKKSKENAYEEAIKKLDWIEYGIEGDSLIENGKVYQPIQGFNTVDDASYR